MTKGNINLNEIENPFLYPIPSSVSLNSNVTWFSDEQFHEVQLAMRNISIDALIKALYDEAPTVAVKGCDLKTFVKRLYNGAHQTLISDVIKPTLKFLNFEGSNKNSSGNCLITTANLKNGHVKGVRLIHDIVRALLDIGFEGQFIYLIGGFPTPNSFEIQWAAVPYSFKVFMFVTAQKNGCENVLWIDGQLFPINDLTPIFRSIEENGALLDHGTDCDSTDEMNERFILAGTRALLLNLTGIDVVKKSHIFSIVMGLKVTSPLVQSFVDEFYDMVRRGTPFLSLFPEEYVFGAILYQPKYSSLHGLSPALRLLVESLTLLNRTKISFHSLFARKKLFKYDLPVLGGFEDLHINQRYKNEGYFFIELARNRTMST